MRIIIEPNNVWAHIESPGGIQTQLNESLRFRPPGYRFVDSYKRGYWDGYISLLDKTGRFPVGLVDHVLDSIPQGRKLIECEDQRHPPFKTMAFPKADPAAMPLHDVQREAIKAALLKVRGIINYPTGTGKGRIMGGIIAERCVPTLVIVDKTDLLSQLAKEIEPFIGEKVGRIGAGSWTTKSCTIATIQSLASAFKRDHAGTLELLKNFKMVICDETHHAESESYQTILDHMPLAYYRYGFSGTPFRSYKGKSDGIQTYLKVQAILGPEIASLTISEAVETGRIVAPDIYMIHMDEPLVVAGIDVSRMNYRDVYNAFIVDNEDRNLLAYALATKLPGQNLILVESIDHGMWFDQRGLPFVQGSTPSEERKILYSAFKQGVRKSLVLSKLANEALDLPNVNNLIMAGGGQAPHIKIQQIGRALRADGSKTSANVFDFEDTVKYLDKHTKARRKLYQSEAAYTLLDIDEEDIWGLLGV